MITFRPYADAFSDLFPVILYIFWPTLSLSPLNHQHTIQRIFEIECDFKISLLHPIHSVGESSGTDALCREPLPNPCVRARRLTGAYLYPIYFPQTSRISPQISSAVFPSVATFTSAAASYFGLRFSINSSIYPTFIFPFSTGLSVLSFTRS